MKKDGLLDMMTKTIKDTQHKEAIEKVNQYLAADADLTNQVLWLLMSGKLQPKVLDPRVLPMTSNMFRLLPCTMKELFIKDHAPSLASQLHDLKQTDRDVVNKLLQYGLDINLRCAVLSKHVGTLCEVCKTRHEEIGSCLDLSIKVKVIKWDEAGLFHVLPKSDGPYTHLVHCSGMKCSLEEVVQTIAASWSLDKNWDVTNICMKKGNLPQVHQFVLQGAAAQGQADESGEAAIIEESKQQPRQPFSWCFL